MPEVNLPLPCEAYAGDEAFLFVSYAHKDGSLVFPEIRFLHECGYRVWYDEGIDPGNEWPEEIAKAISKATVFVVFISPNAVVSNNVRNEINFALNAHKPFLAIHVTPTDLPAGLQLRMGDIQAVLRFQMTQASYRRKLEKVLPKSCVASLALFCESMWESLLDRQRTASVFLGASHNPANEREMVADWDVRAAAGLLSYLAAHRFSAALEPPVFSPESIAGRTNHNRETFIEEYIRAVRTLLSGKSAIVIGSADQNPLAEVLLGDLQMVDSSRLFRTPHPASACPETVLAYRKAASSRKPEAQPARFFYRHESLAGGGMAAGFHVGASKRRLETSFLSQDAAVSSFQIMAHLLFAGNPYAMEGQKDHVVMLGGLAGVSTYALSALLVGRLGDPEAASPVVHDIANGIHKWQEAGDRFRGVEMILSAQVQVPQSQLERTSFHRNAESLLFDFREVSRCRVVPDTLRLLPRVIAG